MQLSASRADQVDVSGLSTMNRVTARTFSPGAAIVIRGFIPIPSQTKSVNGTVYGFDPGVIDNATGPVRYNAAADVFPKHATQGTQLVDKNCSFWTLGTVRRLPSRLATAGPAPAAI